MFHDAPFFAKFPVSMPVTTSKPILKKSEMYLLTSLFSNEKNIKKGKIGGSDGIGSSEQNDNIRNVETIDLLAESNLNIVSGEVNNIIQKILYEVDSLNKNTFRFDIERTSQMELARYGVGGKYTWHMDSTFIEPYIQRKLSYSINLNDFSEYEGGKLKFMGYNNQPNSNFVPGMVTVFPSYLYHTVTPVTKGTRYSLFGWIDGPRWR